MIIAGITHKVALYNIVSINKPTLFSVKLKEISTPI